MAVLQLPMLVVWVRFPPSALKRHTVTVQVRTLTTYLKFTRKEHTVIKRFKWLLKVLIASIVIGVLALIAVITLVDPNQFKETLQKQISLKTGRVLTITGPILWRINPNLVLEVFDLKLGNTSSFQNEFATIQKAKVEAKLWSIFSGKLLYDIHLDGLKAHLIRNPLGQTNWEDLSHLLSKLKLRHRFLSRFLLPNTLVMEDAQLIWQDDLHHQKFSLDKLYLSSRQFPLGLSGHSSPIELQFYFEDLIHARSGNIHFNTQWQLSDAAQTLNFHALTLKMNVQNLSPSVLTGEITVNDWMTQPTLHGNVQLSHFDLHGWLTLLDIPHWNLLPKNVEMKGIFSYHAPWLEVPNLTLAFDNHGILEGKFKMDLRGNTLQTLTLNGHAQGKRLQIGRIPLSDLQASFEAKEGLLNFTAFNLRCINSQHQGTFKIDFKESNLKYALTTQIDSPEISEVLALFNASDRLKGRFQAKATLTTEGNNLFDLLQSLSGETHITLTDGKLRGIQLLPLLQHAQTTIAMLSDSFSKKQSINVAAVLTAELGEWKQQAVNPQPLATHFSLAEIHTTFDNGSAYTSDLKLIHPEYTINGKGSIDLLHKKMDYHAFALLNNTIEQPPEEIASFLKETPLSIQVKGTLLDPAVRPDLAGYTQNALKLVQSAPREMVDDDTLEKLFGFP